MHHADIIASLHKAKSSPATVARQLKLRPSTISMVIRGKGKSRRVARHISRAVGIPVNTLWPGQYPRKASRRTAQ